MKNQTKITAEPGRQELFITREFDAPREVVFRAFTDPKLFAQWQGPKEHKTKLEKFEPKSGGSWRYVNIDGAGNEFGFHGVIHDVTAPERIIQTFEYEGQSESGHTAIETAKFEALPNNRTRLVAHSVFQSVEDRDGMIEAGMERGVLDAHERLDALLPKVAKM